MPQPAPQDMNQDQVMNVLMFVDAWPDESVKAGIFGRLGHECFHTRKLDEWVSQYRGDVQNFLQGQVKIAEESCADPACDGDIMMKSHYLKPIWRVGIIGPGVLFWLMPLFPYVTRLKVTGSLASNLIGFAFIFLFGLCAVVEGLTDRIVTSSDHIEYVSLFFRISSTWDDVQDIKMNPYGMVNLILHQPVMWTLPPIAWYFRLVGLDRIIQLSPFVDNWQTSELAQEIRTHAPRLFKTGAARYGNAPRL